MPLYGGKTQAGLAVQVCLQCLSRLLVSSSLPVVLRMLVLVLGLPVTRLGTCETRAKGRVLPGAFLVQSSQLPFFKTGQAWARELF